MLVNIAVMFVCLKQVIKILWFDLKTSELIVSLPITRQQDYVSLTNSTVHMCVCVCVYVCMINTGVLNLC